MIITENRILGVGEDRLSEQGAAWTAREITQQPETLRATARLIETHGGAIDAFLRPLFDRPDLRVVLAGAGTSAFIGECVAPWLGARFGGCIEAIATTDIVAAPRLHLHRDRPTLLVSLGRSGDSPESRAAVDLAEAEISECHHLIITCNPDGGLARGADTLRSAFVLILPPATNDRGFAMTSSFTAMSFATLALLGDRDGVLGEAPRIADAVEHVIDTLSPELETLAARGFDRVVYLGAHGLTGLAHEAALKLLELSDGRVVAIHDTPLGFRHGPKTFINARTLAVMFLSNDPHARRYDLDLAAELAADARAGEIILVDAGTARITGARRIAIPEMADASDAALLFPYAAVAQLFAFYVSLALSLTPDQPNVSGTVNRVVQGVRIHALG